MEKMEKIFLEKLKNLAIEKGKNCTIVFRENYDRILARLTLIKNGEKKALQDFNLLKQYEIAEYEEVKVLFRKGTGKRVVCAEDVFGIIKSAHISTGHGGRDVTHKHLNRNFANITRAEVLQFVNLCEECQLKRSRVSKSIVVKPILSKELNSRCQVDLIDMQSQPDGPFKFILNYQDHLTKFLCLRPLKTKSAEAVAEVLIPIFCELGAPSILHSDNGKEFANQVIKAVSELWNDCRLVRGKPRHSQSQGSVERSNQDVENKLACWIRDNKPRQWSEGLPFIQFQKNICHHRGIGRSPYEAMFGCPPKCGLFSLNIPKDVLACIETEEQLESLILSENPDQQTTADNEKEIPTLHGSDLNSSDSLQTIPETNPCVICTLDVSEDESCSGCKCAVHFDERCSVPAQQGSAQLSQRLCMICEKQEDTQRARRDSFTSLKRQADKMLESTAKRLQKVDVGSTVLVAIPNVDRGKGDHKNLKGVVLSEKEGFYKIGTEFGKLKSSYTRNQFSSCVENFLDVDSIPEIEITLREAAKKSSTGTGQGFFFCKCSKKSKCRDGRCKCRKNKRVCGSKCHNSDSCCNKG